MSVRLRRAPAAARPSAPSPPSPPSRLPHRSRGAAALAALAAFACASAHAATITCPPQLVETPMVSSLLAGWNVDVRAGWRTLADAAIHVSRGSERKGIAPDGTTRSGRQETAAWTLAPGDGEVYWVACSYGNTSALLVQRVPDAVHHCVARYDVASSGRHLNVRPVECD